MKFRRIFLLVLLVFTFVFQSFAWWGQTGHRIIGEIAESHLSQKARIAIRNILGTESLAIASTWADFVKSDSAFSYLNNWHYINLKPGLTHQEFTAWLKTDTAADAFTKLNFLIRELKKKTLPADKKKFYLRLLIHITGDIHQPLHTGREEDQGGNRIKIFWFNEPTNLHSLWDEKLIDMQKLSYTEYSSAINHSHVQQRMVWQQQPLAEWFYESYLLADKIYKSITQPEPKLGYRYNYEYIDIVNTQLLKGGVRLAGLLNSIFK